MNTPCKDTESGRYALAVGVWENEGGAPASDMLDHQYGGKVETDRSRALHHVFTSVGAPVGGGTMTTLCRSDTTDRLLSPDQHAYRRGKGGGELPPPASIPIKAAWQP